ncbi:MAG: hypothetical protein ABIR24_11490 [Verrucomicrobiota bacterium]
MWNRSVWLVWLLVLPLALILGYLLATPDDLMSFGFIGLILFSLSLPLLLRWHHALLIFSWNALIMINFLPGVPYLWMLLSFASLTISVVQRTIDKQFVFLKAPSVTLPLLFLGGVVFVTAQFTGGIGLAAFGSALYGGKKYFYVLAAIVGYFALMAQPVPRHRAKLYTILFFLTGLTAAVSNLIYLGGPSFYFLYGFFPAEFAVNQAMVDQGFLEIGTTRISGLNLAGVAVFCALLASGGLRDVFNRPWKFLVMFLAFFAGMLSGFRSATILLGLLFVFMFFFQRLHRTILFPKLILIGLLGAALLLPFISKMPFSVQRALSVLPIKVDPAVSRDAEGTSLWRLDMWKILIPQIPTYFFKGKGFALDPTDLYLEEQSALRGLAGPSDLAILVGEYHNGPLTVMLPFGIFGAIGFVWFLAASWWALYRNYQFGEPELRHINAVLLAFFSTKAIYFLFVFGAFSSDLFGFIGLIGLSISLNGGIKEKRDVKAVEIPYKREDATVTV